MADNPLQPRTRAVFLSYAHEDAEAARRIADALRAFGVEVWFDVTELRGGDAWDQKIKRQIRECALFLPIISSGTQARHEGYFRREWKLAVERAADIAAGIAFIVPVVVDDIAESAALVPDEFMTVQWTRLDRGVPTPEFVQQIRTLLESPRRSTGAVRSHRAVAQGAPVRGSESRTKGMATAWKVGVLAAVLGGAIAAGVVVYRPTRQQAQENMEKAPPSELRQLVERAKSLQEEYAQDDTQRDSLILAEQLCQRATQLDPTDGEAWAIYGRVLFGLSNFDSTNLKLEEGHSAVRRAVLLAPDLPEVQLALADSLRKQGGRSRIEAEQVMRKLVRQVPDDKRMLRMMGLILRASGKPEEALVYWERAAALPGGDAKSLQSQAQVMFQNGRYAEAEAAVNEALALRPTAAARILKISFMISRDELDEAKTLLEAVPASALRDDRAAYVASWLWLWRREPDKALTVLRGAARDFFDDPWISISVGGLPRASIMADAHQLAGRPDAAAAERRAALQVIDQRLKGTPNNISLLLQKACLLAQIGEKDQADSVYRLFQQLRDGEASYFPARRDWDDVSYFLARGERDAALDKLESIARRIAETPDANPVSLVTNLRREPNFDPLREDPRFDSIVLLIASKE